MRNLLIPLVLLLWVLLGWKMCADYATCCGKEVVVTTPPIPVVEQPKPCTDIVCFERNDCDPNFCASWADFRDSIINAIGANQKLLITGYYGPSESNSSTFENLGVCRADTIRRSIMSYLGSKVVEVAGQLRVGQGSGNQGYSCERTSFRIIGEDAGINSSTLIYFPINSTDKLADLSVETYLKQVAKQVKASDQKVRLIGHTDSQGNNAYNMNLGRQRANIIKNYLISQGLPASQIIVKSQGETKPVANNATEEGRAKNRRAELLIIN